MDPKNVFILFCLALKKEGILKERVVIQRFTAYYAVSHSPSMRLVLNGFMSISDG